MTTRPDRHWRIPDSAAERLADLRWELKALVAVVSAAVDEGDFDRVEQALRDGLQAIEAAR